MSKSNIDNQVGKKYGRLTIKSLFISNKRTRCVAICECGDEKDYALQSLKSGLTKSCGCIRKERNNGSVYYYNEDFFDTLTEKSAYVIGLIYTDGYLSKNGRRFVISLQESDKHILEEIGMLIRNSKDVKFFSRISKKNPDKLINGYYIACNNNRLCSSLIRYGVYNNKTNTISPSNLLINNRHFWRGCIDGDGGISLLMNKYLGLNFGGTKQMVDGFINFINLYINYNSKYRYVKNLYQRIYLTGKNAKTIYHILYDNSNISINRKNKYMEYAKLENIIAFDSFNI